MWLRRFAVLLSLLALEETALATEHSEGVYVADDELGNFYRPSNDPEGLIVLPMGGPTTDEEDVLEEAARIGSLQTIVQELVEVNITSHLAALQAAK